MTLTFESTYVEVFFVVIIHDIKFVKKQLKWHSHDLQCAFREFVTRGKKICNNAINDKFPVDLKKFLSLFYWNMWPIFTRKKLKITHNTNRKRKPFSRLNFLNIFYYFFKSPDKPKKNTRNRKYLCKNIKLYEFIVNTSYLNKEKEEILIFKSSFLKESEIKIQHNESWTSTSREYSGFEAFVRMFDPNASNVLRDLEVLTFDELPWLITFSISTSQPVIHEMNKKVKLCFNFER